MLNLNSVGEIVILSLALSSVSMTVTMMSVFQMVRDFIESKSKFLGKLFSCPYCFSHWMALLAAIVFQPRPVETTWLVADLIVATFAMVTLTTYANGLIFKVVETMGG